MEKYEDPTKPLQSHNWSEEYKANYEKIFGKKETWLERRERETEQQGVIGLLVRAVHELDRQNIPKEDIVLVLTKGQADELEKYLVNPTNLPDQILGCKLEVVDDKSPD